MSLEPFQVFPTLSIDDYELMDSELPSLIAIDEIDTLLSMDAEDCSNAKFVDEFTPLNFTSTPTAVDIYNPCFSKREVQDLMNLFIPQTLPIPSFIRSYSEPIKKITKRTKKCTYAARRKEVALLRQESMVLEKRLNNLRKLRVESSQLSEKVASEKYNLAKAQEENKRLRFLVSNQEAKIRQADAYMVKAHHPDSLQHAILDFL